MERLKTKKPKFRQLKRIGTMALAATIALSVPAVSNVVGKVSPVNNTVVSAAEQTNLMVNVSSQFTVSHNDEYEHWSHGFINDAEIQVDGPEFDITDLTYVVKFPDELAHLLSDDYALDYLFGKITNFDSAQNPFTFTGYAIDEDGEQITISKDEHEPYKHISVNTETNSIEFDFTSFYTENNLEPHVRQDVLGDYYFNNLGFTTPIIVPDSRILDNGTYEFKSAYVRGTSVDLDNVANAYTENLVVDYSTDPEPEVDTTELEALVDEANAYDADDYTDGSFVALTSAVTAAEEVLGTDEATQEEVDEAGAKLQDAIDDLVNTTELAALLAEAEDYADSEEDYTEKSFEALATAAEAALAVFENEDATQDEVDRAADNLQDAINGLVKEEEPEEPTDPEVDKSDLETLVEEANGYDSEDYTEESFAALTSALTVAEEVLEDDEATEEGVNTAIESLEAAISGLVEEQDPEVDSEDLENAVNEANAEDYDAEDYTAESFEAFTAAIEAAEAVLAYEEATQEDVDTALEELQTAIDGLEEAVAEPTPEPEPEVEKDELETVLDDAEGYNPDDYTEESFATLTAAIEDAEAVLADEDATQEEVDAALESLEAAITDLVEEETETETETETPTEDDVSIIDDGSEDDAEKGEGNILPKTATSSFNMILAGFLTLLAGAGSLLLGRRKLN